MSCPCYDGPEWHVLNLRFENCVCEKINVYCDGAASKNGYDGAVAGWGVWFKHSAKRHRNASGPVSGKQTSQRAELMAVLEAIKRAPYPGQLIIHTDSQYAINCLTDWRDRWEKNNYITSKGKPAENRDLIDAVMEVRRERDTKVVLKHVSGHSGDPDNDAADELAKGATKGYYI
ncbi:ribonuclease H-like protein [Microstroma glucosiphilum]|uniref:ribonuclease H n=1 Tax=Pseudomicrostroma glucosiphilum TaxID=1684307 RepID=A0A316U481_9BASI|nr:ribonuclease H-like protein [Pseudomicrostroma glucosiphilum]PWN19618.1 ribonuclease H-like protein [Pseudomicrostroma glucosiphilum]